jgi:hypothetical protein
MDHAGVRIADQESLEGQAQATASRLKILHMSAERHKERGPAHALLHGSPPEIG